MPIHHLRKIAGHSSLTTTQRYLRVCTTPSRVVEVDLLFFDTTSTYFQTDDPDDPVVRDAQGRPVPDQPSGPDEVPGTSTDAGSTDAGADGVGFRTYGKSKDSREDLPQVVIGMAETRAGIPVRVWCWPGIQATRR